MFTEPCCIDACITQELPDALGRLLRLQSLDARNNQLASLPAALGNARNLLELRVGFNKIQGMLCAAACEWATALQAPEANCFGSGIP
jgi:hypothetical protein